jgi:hypothetical protein
LLRTEEADAQEQCLLEKNQAQSPLTPRPELNSKKDPARVQKLQLSHQAKKELQHWAKDHFQFPDEAQRTGKDTEVFQQVALKLVEVLDQLGFKRKDPPMKSSSSLYPREPRKDQAPVKPKLKASLPKRAPAVEKTSGVRKRVAVLPRGENGPRRQASEAVPDNNPYPGNQLPPCTGVLRRRTGEGWRQSCFTIKRTRTICQVATVYLEESYSRPIFLPSTPFLSPCESL